MTGKSIKNCRWCEKCKGYHPPSFDCGRLLLVAQAILAKGALILVGALLVYWFNHPYLTQMELLIDRPFSILAIALASIGFMVCEAAK